MAGSATGPVEIRVDDFVGSVQRGVADAVPIHQPYLADIASAARWRDIAFLDEHMGQLTGGFDVGLGRAAAGDQIGRCGEEGQLKEGIQRVVGGPAGPYAEDGRTARRSYLFQRA